jgi:hypothetical protein
LGDEGFEPSSKSPESSEAKIKAAQNHARSMHGSQSSDTVAVDEFYRKLN